MGPVPGYISTVQSIRKLLPASVPRTDITHNSHHAERSGRLSARGAPARRPGALHDRGVARQGRGQGHGGGPQRGGEEVHHREGFNTEVGTVERFS